LKTKRLMLTGCFAGAALITSPALGEMHKKSMATSASKSQRLAPRTTQVTPAKRHATMQTTPMCRRGSSSRYTGTRQYDGTRYYGSTRYGATGYYGGSRYYSGGGGWSLGGLGYYHGIVDGTLGPQTRAAIAAYEDTQSSGGWHDQSAASGPNGSRIIGDPTERRFGWL
jgi:hypothetical protein